ncbi:MULTISPECIES: hypothetical protein [Bacteria]
MGAPHPPWQRIADFPAPDALAARGALELARHCQSPAITAHAVRSRLWAEVFAVVDGATLSRRFPTKESLIDAVFARRLSWWLDALNGCSIAHLKASASLKSPSANGPRLQPPS